MPRQNTQGKKIFHQEDDSVSSNLERFDPSLDDKMKHLTYKTSSVLEKANHALHREDSQPGIRWTKEENAMIRQSIKELAPSQIDHFLDRIERIQAKNRNNQAQWNKPFEDVEPKRSTNQSTSTETIIPCHGIVKEPVRSNTASKMKQPSIEESALNRPEARPAVNSPEPLKAAQRLDEQGVQSATVKKPSAFTFFNTRSASSSHSEPRSRHHSNHSIS